MLKWINYIKRRWSNKLEISKSYTCETYEDTLTTRVAADLYYCLSSEEHDTAIVEAYTAIALNKPIWKNKIRKLEAFINNPEVQKKAESYLQSITRGDLIADTTLKKLFTSENDDEKIDLTKYINFMNRRIHMHKEDENLKKQWGISKILNRIIS